MLNCVYVCRMFHSTISRQTRASHHSMCLSTSPSRLTQSTLDTQHQTAAQRRATRTTYMHCTSYCLKKTVSAVFRSGLATSTITTGSSRHRDAVIASWHDLWTRLSTMFASVCVCVCVYLQLGFRMCTRACGCVCV